MDRSPQGVRRGAAAVTSSDPALHTLSYLHTREFDTRQKSTALSGCPLGRAPMPGSPRAGGASSPGLCGPSRAVLLVLFSEERREEKGEEKGERRKEEERREEKGKVVIAFNVYYINDIKK